MLKNLRVILNNMNPKPYLKGKGSFKLYSDSGKNLTPLPKDSDEMRRINSLETDLRYNNLRVYSANMAKLRGKQFTLVALPILAGVITFFSWTAKPYTKTESLPTYKKHVIEMDEKYLYRDEVDPINYVYTDLPRTYVGGQSAERITSTTGDATIIFGEGKDSLQVTFYVKEDGTWSYRTNTTNPYFNVIAEGEENAVEKPSKYDNLIDEAANIFKSKVSDNSKKAKLVDEILSNNKNDIIAKIEMYESIGDLSYETSHSHWLWRILMIICDIVLAAALIFFRDDLTTVSLLDSDKGKLDEYSEMSIFYAAYQYKAALLQAEKERIEEIDSIIKKNNGTGEILSKFEKKLIK